jgi:hypothetical protein
MRSTLIVLMMLAHSWYPWACCSGEHCHPVPCESIKAHALGLSWNGIVFTAPMIRDSLDDQCHVCVEVSGTYTYPYCIFTPKPKPA